MENSSKNVQRKTKVSMVLSVRKALSDFILEELKASRPLKVTYIDCKKKPKIVKRDSISELSTDEE
jgi:hypothetical protein